MENSQPLATESFSYSWLTHRQPPPSDLFTSNLKPTLRKNSNGYDDNFNFDVPAITSPTAHADEIFSDGQIRPASDLKTSTSVPSSPIPSLADGDRCYVLRKWRRSSKNLLRKCFLFVKALPKVSRKSSRVDDLERKVFEVRSFSNSLEASPRPSCSAYSVVEWRSFEKFGHDFDLTVSPSRSGNVGCDAENSIHEAILYCKKSIGK